MPVVISEQNNCRLTELLPFEADESSLLTHVYKKNLLSQISN